MSSDGDGSRRPARRFLLFHKSLAGFSYSSTNFPPRRLIRLLSWLQESGWDFVGLDTHGSVGEPAIGITFDDGYEHLVEVLPPLIEKFGIRPIVFIPTAFIGKPANWDYSYWFRRVNHLERRSSRSRAEAGVEFGSHGHRHIDLTSLTLRKLEEELRASRDTLADITGRPIRAIGYPFGRFNRRVTETAGEFGLVHGFTSRFPTADDSPGTRGRIAVYGYDTLLSISLKLGERRLYDLERLKSHITNQLSGGTVVFNRMRRFR